MSKNIDIDYSKLNIESTFLENMYDIVIDKNINDKNIFDKVANNGPTIISNVPFFTTLLVLPANEIQETSLNER